MISIVWVALNQWRTQGGARGAIAPLRLSRPLKILNVTPQVTDIYIQPMLSTKSA